MSSRRTVASGSSLSPTRRTPRARPRGSEPCAIFSPVPRIPQCENTRHPAPTSTLSSTSGRSSSKAHRDLKLDSMPAFLMPRKGRYGLTDYEKMFCPDLKSGADIFDLRGVDRRHGCVVVVRPDQYVAHVLPLDEYAELESFFDGFMMPRAAISAPPAPTRGRLRSALLKPRPARRTLRCPQPRGRLDSLELIVLPGALRQRGRRLFAHRGGQENLIGRGGALRAGGDVYHRADRGQVVVRAAKLAKIDTACVEADADADRRGVSARTPGKALPAVRAKAPGSSARPRLHARHGPDA